MATTTKLQDWLGRWLNNGTPGTTNASDFLGRQVQAGDKDYMGQSLTLSEPAAWAASHAYTVGAYVNASGGIMKATVAGTSGAAAPTWPTTVGGGVNDGASVPPLHWVRVR